MWCMIVVRGTPCVCRGGVLEPEGIVSIKYRAGDIQKAIHRMDPICVGLVADLRKKGNLSILP